MSDNNLCRFLHIDKRSDFNNKVVEYTPGSRGCYKLVIDMNNIMTPNNTGALMNRFRYLAYNSYPFMVSGFTSSEPIQIFYNDIVFIEDTNEIWTLGRFYQCQLYDIVNNYPIITKFAYVDYPKNCTDYIIIYFDSPSQLLYKNGFIDITLRISYDGYDSTSNLINQYFYLNVSLNPYSSTTYPAVYSVNWHPSTLNWIKKSAIIDNTVYKFGCMFKPNIFSLLYDMTNPDESHVIHVEGIGVLSIDRISEAQVIQAAQYGKIELPTE